NGTLAYTAGSAVSNNLSVSLGFNGYVFNDTEPINVLGGLGGTGSGTNTVTIPTSAVPQAGMLLNLGDRNDVVTINSTAHAISVKGGDGNDIINVGGPLGGILNAIQAPITVDGEVGTDTLHIDNTLPLAAYAYTVSATRVSVAGGPDIRYTAENLTVDAGVLA